MSTRSYICKETAPGQYEGVYCHSDGYLEFTGAMLIDHYSNREKVDELLALGDLSILGPNIKPDPEKGKHSFEFDERQDGVVVAYHRDRGEELSPAKRLTIYKLAGTWADYAYFYTLEGEWKYIDLTMLDQKYANSDTPLRDIKTDLDSIFKSWGIERPENEYGYYPPEYREQLKEQQQAKKAEAEM